MSSRIRLYLWSIWFILLFVAPYTPVMDKLTPMAASGTPWQLLVWFGWTILLATSITVFAATEWARETKK